MFEVMRDSESALHKSVSYRTLLSSITFSYIPIRKMQGDHLLFKDAIAAVYLGFFLNRVIFLHSSFFLLKGTKSNKVRVSNGCMSHSAAAHLPLL